MRPPPASGTEPAGRPPQDWVKRLARHGGWSFRFPAPDAEAFKFEALLASDVQLVGRVTYEGHQNCLNACCRHARIGRSRRVMRRLGQGASRSQVLSRQECSGVEKAILATTTP